MAPAADTTDQRLVALQVKVAEARASYDDLCSRFNVLDRNNYRASATALRVKRDRAFNEFKRASTELASYISRRQRGLK